MRNPAFVATAFVVGLCSLVALFVLAEMGIDWAAAAIVALFLGTMWCLIYKAAKQGDFWED